MESINSPSMMRKGSKTIDTTFNALVISLLGIIGTSTAILLYHMLLVKYCARRGAGEAAASAGVDVKVLRTIPIHAFSAVRGENINQDDECAVCLGELEDEDQVRLLPSCDHAFHVACIDRWFAAHATCPMCRSPVALHPASSDPSAGAQRAVRGDGGASSSPPPPRAQTQSPDLLRHCASLVVEPPAERISPRLKRSLSMDQYLIATDLRSVDCPCPCSSSPCSDLSHLGRVSSKLRRSFSRLRVGKAGHGAILPY